MIEIITSGISAIALIAVAILSKGHSEKLKEIRHQVKNDHGNKPHPNLRDDLDAKFGGLETQMKRANSIQEAQGREIRGLRNDISDLHDSDRKIREDLENTRPRPKMTKPKETRP